MRARNVIAAGLCATTLIAASAAAQELPVIRRNGEAVQLMVDGRPYVGLAGEVHNSSPSSPTYMAPIWDRLARMNVRTVIGAASWELVEPREGVYDFAAVDDQIKQARARGMRLILIWFGGYKNAESTYTPTWVRRDVRRFPRAVRAPASSDAGPLARLRLNPVLSVFGDETVKADARAFAALMAHIKAVDPDRTVIMMQVQNEAGLLGDSRDRSPTAEAAWKTPVPAALTRYLTQHRARLRPGLLATWGRQGYLQKGTWAQVFGTDDAAEEIFMAWGFGRYIERVAQAGIGAYPLPMFANAWLGPKPGQLRPGQYPSGGPVAVMMDVWKAAAPSLATLAPDIYVPEFEATLQDYKRTDNPILVPEAKPDTGNMFVAVGQYAAIAFSPFGIEDAPEDGELAHAYGVLNNMTGQIAAAQADGRIRGFRIAKGEQWKGSLEGYQLVVSGPRGTLGAFGPGTGSPEPAITTGYGLAIASGPDEFLVAGRGISVNFSVPGAIVEVDAVQEGRFKDERWVPGRTMNGDQRYFLFSNDEVRIMRFKMLRR